jgi:hypothetical protein
LEVDVGSDQIGWLEVAKALGPYITAIVAMVGVFLSARLAQRNWLKQFGKQQSVALLNRRLDLAHELPSKLFEATQLGHRVVINGCLAQTLAILNSEGRQFSQETIDRLVKEEVEAEKIFQDALGEILKLLLSVSAFFNDQIYEEASHCVQALQQVVQSDGDTSALLGDLKQSIPPDTTVEQALVNITRVLNEHLKPISGDIAQRVGKLARRMVEFAQASG